MDGRVAQKQRHGGLTSVEEWTRGQLEALVSSSSSTWDAATAAIDYLTGNAGLVQERVLASILSRNAPSLYLSQFGLTTNFQPNDSHHSPLHDNRHEAGDNLRENDLDNGAGNPQSTHHRHDSANIIYDDHSNAGNDGIAINAIEQFRKLVPVVAYSDIEPFIRQIAQSGSDASAPVLCTPPVTEFLASSGTTAGGEAKLIPTIAEDRERRWFTQSIAEAFVNHYFPSNGKLGLFFLITKPGFQTPGGLAAKAYSTSLFETQEFKAIAPKHFVSPVETILCKDVYRSLYCQLLCGLIRYREVHKMGSIFATAFVRAIKVLQDEWQSLCHDIQCGPNATNNNITDMPAVMELLSGLTPAQSASLVDRITAECSKDSWQGILTRLWPNAAIIQTIVTGTMSQYVPVLDFYSGGLPLVSSFYGSSESYIGINLQPGLTKPSDISYTMLPNMAYFEFLPLEPSSLEDSSGDRPIREEDAAVTLTDVEVGKEYELLLTTYAGLYRYKIGDVLRVTGFHNSCPQVQIVYRRNVVLSVDQEKTDEGCLHRAITASSEKLQSDAGAKLSDYTSYCDLGSIPGHYVIFWELLTPSVIEDPLLEACCLCIEESLDSMYRQCRAYEHTIGPLEIRVVQGGTFGMLMDYHVTKGSATMAQYKTPRCIKTLQELELLASRVTQKAFSPHPPSWVPHH